MLFQTVTGTIEFTPIRDARAGSLGAWARKMMRLAIANERMEDRPIL